MAGIRRMGPGGPLKEIQQPKIDHPQGKQLVADPLTAGDTVVLHLLENVEPFISAGASIGHDLAGQVGDVDAVAGPAHFLD